MSTQEHIVIRISDLDPDEREDIEHLIQQALDADAYLHIEVRKVGRANDNHTPVEREVRR